MIIGRYRYRNLSRVLKIIVENTIRFNHSDIDGQGLIKGEPPESFFLTIDEIIMKGNIPEIEVWNALDYLIGENEIQYEFTKVGNVYMNTPKGFRSYYEKKYQKLSWYGAWEWWYVVVKVIGGTAAIIFGCWGFYNAVTLNKQTQKLERLKSKVEMIDHKVQEIKSQ